MDDLMQDLDGRLADAGFSFSEVVAGDKIVLKRAIANRHSQVANGPGTELKQLLSRVGITATLDCPCNDRAAEMDRQGVEWCEANIDAIVGWLREQAEARGLPFLDVAGRMLVRRAIKNARKSLIDP